MTPLSKFLKEAKERREKAETYVDGYLVKKWNKDFDDNAFGTHTKFEKITRLFVDDFYLSLSLGCSSCDGNALRLKKIMDQANTIAEEE